MSDILFLESHVRALYRLLGHRKGEYTDVRVIDVNKKGSAPLARKLLQGEESFVAFAKQWNGEGNVFVGRNPRSADAKVCRIGCFTLDIDPEREAGTASTAVQFQRAIEAARKIVQTYRSGYIAESGNGTLVVYRTPEYDGDFKAYERALARLQDEAQKLCPEGVKVDATHDSARLIKVIGTMSTKGDRKDWRVSRFDRIPSPPYRVSEALRPFLSAVSVEDSSIKAGQPIHNLSETTLSPTARLKNAEDALTRLGAHRAEDYDSWLKVGIALKEFGDVGLQLWRTWSKKSPKYKEGDCEGKWGSFKRDSLTDGPKLSIGTIIKWAEQDSPSSIRGAHGLPAGISLSELYSPNGNLGEHKRRLLERGVSAGPELPTGLTNLDRHTWGFVRGELFTVAARTGIGKTSIATAIARNLLQNGKRVLFFSTEMSANLIINRMLSAETKLSGDCFKTGQFSDEQLKELDRGYAWLKEVGERLAICDSTSPGIERVKALANDYKPDVLVFDHIQRVGGKSDSIRHNVSEFIRGLKDTARTNNCAVLVLSQLRRMFRDLKSGQIPPPQMSDLKESGTIEEESGQVLLLSVMSERPDDPVCHLLGSLEKNRFGETCKIGIEFDRSIAIFREMGGP